MKVGHAVFADQVVIVTGAGHGLGRVQALDFARHGARVVVNSLNPGNAEAVVAEITAIGGHAVACGLPVGTADAGQELIDLALREFGDVHAVVNNAGVIRNGYFEDQTAEALQMQFAAHVAGPFFVTQAAWPVFRRNGYGRVVMTGSSAMFGMLGAASYAATKAAVFGLARALAVEGRPHGINVNVLLPQASTDIRARNLALGNDPSRPRSAEAASAAHNASFPAGLRNAISAMRVPEAVSPLALYLASPGCEHTGETFAAGCGRFAHVFLGETPGWVATSSTEVTIEDVAAHMPAVTAWEGAVKLASVLDEIELMAQVVGVWTADDTR
jgi:NAD(P)-dependent dehydrogenase (short-subunit alcohol dehydrogenase family)